MSSRKRAAFTLTEILIVIAIIVILIALAVPAFSLITGGKSIEGATNQLSAALGRARAEAIGLQKPTGVLFFIEPRSNRAMIAIVKQSEAVSSSEVVWLDLADADFIPLPIGVTVQTIADTSNMSGTAYRDRYLGFNVRGVDFSGAAKTCATPFGGVILFDSFGRLVSSPYGLRCVDSANANTSLGGLLKVNGLTTAGIGIIPAPASSTTQQLLRSQFGLVMFERDLFATQNGNDADYAIDATGAPPATETTEEAWLDNNSTPILINRYTGTLVKGD